MPKKNKMTNVSANYGQKPTFKDKEGNLWIAITEVTF